MSELSRTFDEDAENYDRCRPRYVPALFSDILRYAAAGSAARALEIGIGTGQATEPFLRAGFHVTALEPGGNLSACAGKKFGGESGFAVIETTFEDFCAGEESFDLIYSATAFHWIERETGLQKARRLLRPGGTLALFWNHPLPEHGEGPLHEDIQRAYRTYRPEADKPRIFDGSTCPAYAAALREQGFRDVCWRLYHGVRKQTAEEYIALLNTYSDHRVMAEAAREGLEREIAAAVHAHGGTVHVCDTMDLYLGRR